MAMTKAMIEILEPSVDPSRGLQPVFYVQFNPTDYTRVKGAQIAEINIPGIDSPILQFVRGQNEKLTLDLFFDTTAQGMVDPAVDVQTLTAPFYQLVKIQPTTHAPPRLRFTWGQSLSFKAIVESISQKFTLFSPGGTALRATLSVTFREYKTLDEQIAEMKLQSADHSKSTVIRRGDTLSGIAAKTYGDPTRWREIADAPENKVAAADPLHLVPGATLTIPPLDLSLSRRTSIR
jgi:nucleoid-associated protein YgaU